MRRWKKGRRGSSLLAALSHVAVWSLLLPSVVPVAEAAIITVNVDNANGDEQTGDLPVYGGTWTAVSAARPCVSRFCPLQPNVTSAFDGTYHYGVSTSSFDDSVTVTINFRGISVRVFFITFTGSDFDTFAHFTLDGIDRTSFLNGQRSPFSSPLTARFQFDRVVFELEGLANSDHTLVIGSKASNNFTNVLMFDRMQYKFDDAALPSRTTTSSTSTSTSSTSTQATQTIITTATVEPSQTSGSDSGSLATSAPRSSNSSNIGKIVGGVIGGVAALALIAAFAMLNFLCANRRRRKDHFGPYTRRDAVLGDESSVVEEQAFQSSPFVGGEMETQPSVMSSIRPASYNGRPTLGRSISDYNRRSGPPTVMSSIKDRPLSYALSLSSHHSHGRRSSHGHLSSIGHGTRYSYQNYNHPYNSSSNYTAANPYNPGNHPYNPNGSGANTYGNVGNNMSHSSSSILLNNNNLPPIPQEDPITPPFGFPTSKRVSPVGSEESISSLPQNPSLAMIRRVSSASSAHEIASIRAQIHRLEAQLDRLADNERDAVSVIPEAGESEHNPPAYPGRPKGLHLVDLPGRSKEGLFGESRSWTGSNLGSGERSP